MLERARRQKSGCSCNLLLHLDLGHLLTAWVILGFLLTQLLPEGLFRLFNNEDEALLSMGTHAIRTFLMMMPIIGFQIVSANYFQAVGKPLNAMLLTLSRQVLLLIPLILILPHFHGLNGIWIAGPASDLLSSLWTAVWLLVELRQLRSKHAQSVAMKMQFAE